MIVSREASPQTIAFLAGGHPLKFRGRKLSISSTSPPQKVSFRPTKDAHARATLSEEFQSEQSEQPEQPEQSGRPETPGQEAPPDGDLRVGITNEEYFERMRAITEAETALSNPLGLKKSYEIVRFDEDGTGPLDRYVYVEERDCIGCTHCATTAGGTFFVQQDFGRARVFNQTGDSEAVVEEAIDTCPVNCIYYVNWEDLVNLENMRTEQRINNWARLVGGQDFNSSRRGKKTTTVMDSGIIRCEDCPGRGCGTCPMFGVGQNPEYLRQKAIREEKLRKRATEGRRKKTRRRL